MTLSQCTGVKSASVTPSTYRDHFTDLSRTAGNQLIRPEKALEVMHRQRTHSILPDFQHLLSVSSRRRVNFGLEAIDVALKLVLKATFLWYSR